MAKPLSSRTLLALALVVPVLGCTAKPPEKPIVLRPLYPDRRLAHRPLPRRAPTQLGAKNASSPENAASAEPERELSPDEKEALFREFDEYLARPGGGEVASRPRSSP